jgi:sn-glycerol 3-phosphate transport system substrate-binding protein
MAIFSLNAQEITLWHAFDGPLKEAFEEIVQDFNHQSGSYKVIPIKKGNYADVVKQGLQAFEKGEHPHILQIYEVATLTAMQTKGVFRPVDDLMRSFNKKFDPAVYIDLVRHFYSSPEGKMLSLPWNVSTGLLFYNKEAFKKAGLDPENPPQTWEELESLASKLTARGYTGFTTAWPAAYHLEHLSSWHSLPFATEKNGFLGLSTRFVFNSEERVFHLAKLVEWQKKGIFAYKGRFNEEPEQLFSQGKCAILLQGANRLPLLQKNCPFEIGVGFIPYWKRLVDKPYTLGIGGSSFWVMEKFSEEEYRGIVQFFDYLSSTAVQSFWHEKTGYLPITEAAYHLTKKKGFYKEHPAHEIAVMEVMGRIPTPYSQGVRFGDYMVIRDLIIDQLEKALSLELTPKEALDTAVELGNARLAAFEKAAK